MGSTPVRLVSLQEKTGHTLAKKENHVKTKTGDGHISFKERSFPTLKHPEVRLVASTIMRKYICFFKCPYWHLMPSWHFIIAAWLRHNVTKITFFFFMGRGGGKPSLQLKTRCQWPRMCVPIMQWENQVNPSDRHLQPHTWRFRFNVQDSWCIRLPRPWPHVSRIDAGTHEVSPLPLPGALPTVTCASHTAPWPRKPVRAHGECRKSKLLLHGHCLQALLRRGAANSRRRHILSWNDLIVRCPISIFHWARHTRTSRYSTVQILFKVTGSEASVPGVKSWHHNLTIGKLLGTLSYFLPLKIGLLCTSLIRNRERILGSLQAKCLE